MTDPDVTIDTYLAARTEADARLRSALIERVWAVDGQLIDPPFAAKGRRSIGWLTSVLQVEFPGYTFRRVGRVERDGVRIRFAWRFVAPDGTTVMEGIDDGQLAADGLLRRVTRRHHARASRSIHGRRFDVDSDLIERSA
jgi:hypothetical protein